MGIPYGEKTKWSEAQRATEGKLLVEDATEALIRLMKDDRAFAIKALETCAHTASSLAQALRRGDDDPPDDASDDPE